MHDVVLDYHRRTKHHFRRAAAALGYMDWASQPDPFRRFAGAREVRLPRSDFPADGVADLLFHSFAVSAWKAAGGARWALRVNPSSGNLHPTEAYVVLPATPGIGDAPALFHYGPREHLIEERGRPAPALALPPDSLLVGLTSIHWREAWKYGERAFRYCQHDAGHAIAAVAIAAALRGWRTRLLTEWSAEAVGALLGTDRDADFPVPEEREEPEALMLVSRGEPVELPPPPAAKLRAGVFTGRANRLSPEHHDWPVIDGVAAATRSPGFAPASAAPTFSGPPARSLAADRETIRRRRSAVAFDGTATLPRDAFERILAATLPGPHPPFDALPWSPRIHLALFVHRVEGVEPGLMLLERDPAAGPRLRAAVKADAGWEREGDLPLFRLARGDARDLAATLSCRQDIAGDSFFSLGMLADFRRSLDEYGPAFYRSLFHEAGAVGQVLYLAAETEGVRGTGIGCYFDDPVHDALGLADDAFQSLYHFTVGRPVEDRRLTTLPAYSD